jgi:hypothetical protein
VQGEPIQLGHHPAAFTGWQILHDAGLTLLHWPPADATIRPPLQAIMAASPPLASRCHDRLGGTDPQISPGRLMWMTYSAPTGTATGSERPGWPDPVRRGLAIWRRSIATSWRRMRISTFLATALRANRPSQLNSLIVVRYSSRTNTIGDHAMITEAAKPQVTLCGNLAWHRGSPVPGVAPEPG